MPRRNQQNSQGNDDAENRRDHNSQDCCTPAGCSIKTPIRLDNLADCVRVLCNNDACTSGNYMHGACFREFEQGLMIYLKNCGRARSWSDKQRQQNVWTKKGYDLVYRICMCKCGRGHLRKDLDWVPPRAQLNQEVDAKKKKKKNKQNALPVLGLGLPQHQQQQQQQQQQPQNQHGAGSPPRHAGVPVAVSMAPQEPPRPRTSSMSSTGSSSCSPGSGSTSGIDSPSSPTHGIRRKSSNEICVVDRARHGSGGNSSFSRRPDFSSFNVLPRHKINSYHIKIDDDGQNDDIRPFILNRLLALKISRVSCCLCNTWMTVFDRCPLIDGTFFLSPRQHSKQCIEVKYENRAEYLNSVCMGCLEGWGSPLKCRGCNKPWDGSDLVLGSMYAFDIFATVPCCAERLKCTNCNEPVLQPEQSLQFFSDYSRCYECQKCKTFDYHFAKPLSVAFAPKKPTPPQIKAIIHQHSVNAKSASASPPPPSPAPVTPAAMPWLPPQLAAFYHAAPQDLYFLHHQMAPPVRRYHTGFMGDVQHHVSPLAIVAES